MTRKQIVTTVIVSVVAASLFEFFIKPKLNKVLNNAD